MSSARIDHKRTSASVALADKLRAAILQGTMPTGHRLPSERELCEQYGVGRTSVREALKALGAQGLIETTKGRNGGSAVRLPRADLVDETIGRFIQGQQQRFQDVIETRELVEPLVAQLAAQRRTDQDLVELGRTHARLEANFGDRGAFLLANVDWHLAVTRASHNELLVVFMTAISRAIYRETESDETDTDEIRTATVRAHERILDAIVARDPEAAARRMQRHVTAYANTPHTPNSKSRIKEPI